MTRDLAAEGATLRELRKSHGWTAKKLAKFAGVCEESIGKMERGVYVRPSVGHRVWTRMGLRPDSPGIPVRLRRLALGWSMEGLAARAGVSANTVHNLEVGRNVSADFRAWILGALEAA